jgi:hypothetical protein
MDNTTMAITINIDSTTEEESGIKRDINDKGFAGINETNNGCYFNYQYPLENQDQYKAKISFRLMEIVSPVQVGNEGAEHVKKAKSSFESARTMNKLSRDAEKEARKGKQTIRVLENHKKSADWDDDQKASIDGGIKWVEGWTNEHLSESEILRQESIDYAKDGAKSLKDAADEFMSSFKFSDRQVILSDTPGIELYLPVGFQQTDGFQISGTELGLLGGGALAGMSKGDSILKTTLDQFKDGVGSVFDMMSGSLQPGAAAVVGARLANKLAPREVADAFSIAAGVTVNPNLRSIFKGVNLREYTFQFKFLPKSQIEAREVENIIKQFRIHSYPDIIKVGDFAAGYKYPNLFRIAVYVEHEDEIMRSDEEGNEYPEMVTKRKRVGNRMKDCYLRSVSTNYNPSSMSFHPDGRPVEIDLSLSFVEEVTVNRQDVEEGY